MKNMAWCGVRQVMWFACMEGVLIVRVKVPHLASWPGLVVYNCRGGACSNWGWTNRY